jgi:Protein of unknown function (DUF1579)
MIPALVVSAFVALQPPPPPCRVGAFDEFGFYPGAWRVTVVARLSPRAPWEKTEGRSTIAPELAGCAFIERLDTTREGKPLQLLSLLTYDRTARRWQYTVTDSEHGRVQTYEGSRDGDAIVLRAILDLPGGKVFLRRRLRIESGDSFTWESARSTDAGKTWDVTTRFEYRRATGPPASARRPAFRERHSP